MAREDFAILVGVWRYAVSDQYPPLSGPPNDLELWRSWLVDVAGIPDDGIHLRIVRTPEPFPAGVSWMDAPPVPKEFEDIFLEITTDERSKDVLRPDSRLYLYFSGHGFTTQDTADANASLLMANAGRRRNSCIPGTQFAEIAIRNSYFGEVVLIMDSCRNIFPTATPESPSFSLSADTGGPAQGKLLTVYAAPYGQAGFERSIPEDNNKCHGLMTYTLVRALREAPLDSQGQLTSTQVKREVVPEFRTRL